MCICTWAWCSNTVLLVRNYMPYHPNRNTSKNEKKFWGNRCKWRLAKVNQEVKLLHLEGYSPQAALSSLSSQVSLGSCWTLHSATLLPYESSWSWSSSEGRLMVSLVTYTSLENKNLVIIIASVHQLLQKMCYYYNSMRFSQCEGKHYITHFTDGFRYDGQGHETMWTHSDLSNPIFSFWPIPGWFLPFGAVNLSFSSVSP